LLKIHKLPATHPGTVYLASEGHLATLSLSGTRCCTETSKCDLYFFFASWPSHHDVAAISLALSLSFFLSLSLSLSLSYRSWSVCYLYRGVQCDGGKSYMTHGRPSLWPDSCPTSSSSSSSSFSSSSDNRLNCRYDSAKVLSS
jgi:hypothetical protein